MPNKNLITHNKKRRGHHHRRTKDYHKVYLPYLPLVVALLVSVVISGWSPRGNTLAYATNTSVSGLHAGTNNQRAANGLAGLALNSKLNSAAQAKANDMVNRNYWSHNTPDGQEPWIFMDAAGYKYLKAGENLAYGFTDSDGTITGWMNSPSHKANMLDSAFTEVGFGFTNSANFNGSGNQTVVVAMYGKPQTLGASTPAPAPAAPVQQVQTPAPSPAPSSNPAPTPSPASEPTPTETTAAPEAEKQEEQTPFTSDAAGTEPSTQPVTRVAAIAGDKAQWAVFGVGLIVGLAVTAFLMKHALGFRKILQRGEKFVLHHPLFDSTVAGLIILGVTLLQTIGFIK
jgi:uncharacterized protein YkwD